MVEPHRDSGLRKNENMPLRRAPDQTLTLIAHQGVQGYFPPNSFAAIEQAFGIADATEFDMYVAESSSDPGVKEAVVIHPEGYFLFINRAGMKNDAQIPATLEELRSVKFEGRPVVPTLDELLDAYQRRSVEMGKRTELHIELKGPNTAETVIPMLQARISRGELSYDDFLICAFCYRGESETRLETAHRLDPKMRLCLFIRGGDFSQDAFSGFDEVFDYANRLNVELVNLMRRNATVEIVDQIRAAGFKVGCHHSRTSDELEAALSLRVDSVQADFFQGPSVDNYPVSRRSGNPFFTPINESGFYHLRDWIWEAGWSFEKLRSDPANSEPLRVQLPAPKLPSLFRDKVNAILSSDHAGQVILRLCQNDTLSEACLDFSEVKLPTNVLGSFDTNLFSSETPISDFLSIKGQRLQFERLLDTLSPVVLGVESFSNTFREVPWPEVVDLIEGQADHLLRELDRELEIKELEFLQIVGGEVLRRSGRLVGMLAFTALMPRHGNKNDYYVLVDCDLCNLSHFARVAADEQVQAQLLRSGKRGGAIFSRL